MNPDQKYNPCLRELKSRGQEHVVRWWDELDSAGREQLLADLESVPWVLLDPIFESLVRQRHARVVPSGLCPAPVYPRVPRPDRQSLYAEASDAGRALLRDGKVAALTVAGGQGTRLGFDGPKGTLAVTPVGDRTLFELFAETVRAVNGRYGVAIPWYVMTSMENHQATVDFFYRHDFFGLGRTGVVFFTQGMLPAFDLQGRLLLSQKHRLALAPDGHGGSLAALAKSGALADMRRRGIEIISYFQVDNPLVKPFDPLFIGLHAQTDSEMSTKVTSKVDDLERVGNVCIHEDRLVVVEYTQFPEDLARARNPDGTRMFNAGNLGIHLLDVEFVRRIVEQSFRIPFRRAEKVIPFIDSTGVRCVPATPNAVKLEMFLFDVLPLARNPLVLEVDRSEEFSPVKNASGVDSLETAKRDQVARACRWLEAAGIHVPRRPDGSPDLTIAVSPSFALDAEDIRAQRERVPTLTRGDAVYLA